MIETTNPNRVPATVQRPWVIPALGALWLVMLAVGRGLDEAIVHSVRVDDGALALPIVLITGLGDWQLLLAATAFGSAWLLYRREFKLALFLVAWTLAGRALVGLQKLTFGRVRPDFEVDVVGTAGFSFPSGHSANSTIVYLLMALIVVGPGTPRRRAVIATIALAFLIGISRVLLGAHWPSDVIGGWAFGLIWVLLGWRLAQTLKRNSITSPS